MRRSLIVLLLILLLCGTAQASSEQVLMQGTCTNANHYIDLTDGNASMGCSGVDFSPLDGEMVEWYDSSNRRVVGWFNSASGAGRKVYSTGALSAQNWQSKNGSFDNADASGYRYRVLSTNPGRLVASGNLTASNVHLATVDGGAMVEISGTDLSSYAGNDSGGPMTIINPRDKDAATTTANPYYLCLEDSGGKLACGHIGAAGGGEAGNEKFTNANFDSGDSGWTKAAGWTIEDQGAGDYEAVAVAVGTLVPIYQQFNPALATGKLYKLSADVNLVTSGTGHFYFQNSGTGPYIFASPSITTTGSKSLYVTQISNNTAYGYGFGGTDGATFTGRIDSLSMLELTDVAATGVHLFSTPGGTTRNLAKKESGFDPNAVAKYRIYRNY